MKISLATLILAGSLLAQQQSTLTDSKLMGLAQAGVSEAELLRMVSTAPKIDFDLRPESTDAMIKSGVSEEVIKAMAARESGAAVPSALAVRPEAPTIAAAAPATRGPSAPPISVLEVGAYYQSNGQWVEMMPEVVNWRIGGILKTVTTASLIKPDKNGHLRNGRSKTPLHTPVQLLVYAPEGTQVSEYQLIRMHAHARAREFRVVTGAILHSHGDSDRDDIPFDNQHVGVRTWTLTLTGLRPGEYGLLPPGLAESQSASAQLGKMYTFTVVE